MLFVSGGRSPDAGLPSLARAEGVFATAEKQMLGALAAQLREKFERELRARVARGVAEREAAAAVGPARRRASERPGSGAASPALLPSPGMSDMSEMSTTSLYATSSAGEAGENPAEAERAREGCGRGKPAPGAKGESAAAARACSKESASVSTGFFERGSLDMNMEQNGQHLRILAIR